MSSISTTARDPQRAELHRMWSSVAPAWEAHMPYVDDRGRHVSERMLALTDPQPGDRVLELACGVGGPGLDAAQLVLPGGDVVISDFASEMTAIAARRAAERGVANVTARDIDIERIDEPDAAYDIVLCREGLMLVPDPDLGAREMRRVLRPGGRVAIAVWGPPERNPWLSVVFRTVAEQLGVPPAPPGSPHPFALSDAGRLPDVLAGAGFEGVEVEEIAVPYRAASVDEWWNRSAALAGPLAKKLAALPEQAAQALRRSAAERIAAYRTDCGLDIPGLSLLATGVSPGATAR
jgi:ubiquinone/menaquinone biosynthesis C-methylase UbiE